MVENQPEHDFKYNVTVLGQASTGKSSICMRYLYNTFSPEYDPTLQDSHIKIFQQGDQIGCLEILDTAGDPQYLANIQEWIETGEGFLLVYSITNRDSFEYLDQILPKIQLIKNKEEIPIVLVGNRNDLESDRVIFKEEAKQFAQDYDIGFIETSAKLGMNVKQAFQLLIKELFRLNPPKKAVKKQGKFKGFVKKYCQLI